MKHSLNILLIGSFLLGLSPAYGQSKSPKDKKARAKEVAKYWKNELKTAKSTNHRKVQHNYPEIGWLSGLWCREGSKEAYRHYEILGKAKVRLGTKGYTAEDIKVVFKPESFKMGEMLDKPIVIQNKSFYELWSYSGDGKGLYGPIWYVFMERIQKVSDNEFARVFAKSYTHRKKELDLASFMKAESFKINHFKHYKKPRIYLKCN